MKVAIYRTAEALCHDLKNKKEILSSINAVMRLIETVGTNFEDLLNENLERCNFLTLQFDEWICSVNNIAELYIFVR